MKRVAEGDALAGVEGGASVAAKPKRKVPIRSAESEWAPPVEQPVEKPKENVVDKAADNGADPDNPFPRYVDMFRNNPAALAAEFEKEAEAARAEQRGMRDEVIRMWKLDEKQAALFEKALDDLCDEAKRLNEEMVGLIASGQLNEEYGEGRIMSGNRLLTQRFIDARGTAVRETAEKLYEQLVLNGVSDAEEQIVLMNVAHKTFFSLECHEPYLAVYDKVYKNMGIGNGIFGWNVRQRQLKKK